MSEAAPTFPPPPAGEGRWGSASACRDGFENPPLQEWRAAHAGFCNGPRRVKGARESRESELLDSGHPTLATRPRPGGSRSLSAPSTLAGDLLLYAVGARDRHLMGFAKDRSAQSTECVVDATSRMAA